MYHLLHYKSLLRYTILSENCGGSGIAGPGALTSSSSQIEIETNEAVIMVTAHSTSIGDIRYVK